MNKKLELEMSEALLAAASRNPERLGRILNRLSFEQKETMARALLNTLYPTLYALPGGAALAIKQEFNFEVKENKDEQAISANVRHRHAD